MDLSLEEISKILNKNDNFCILTHQYPDGDTLGSAFALCIALQNMGKKAKVFMTENFNAKAIAQRFVDECAALKNRLI